MTKQLGRRAGAGVYLPFASVLAIVAVGMVLMGLQHWRWGTGVVGGALLVAAVLRVVLPTERVELIALRGRAVDVLCYAALGIVIMVVAITITGGPFDPS